MVSAGKLGLAGYLLSAATVAILAFLYVAYYVAFFTYLPSIILRFLAWRRIGREIRSRFFKMQPFLIIVLGAIVFILSIGALVLSGAETDGWPLILAFVVLWPIYSMAETAGYLILGRSKGIKTAYLGATNIPGVVVIAGVVAIAVMGTNPLDTNLFIYVQIASLPLLISALSIAYSLFLIEGGRALGPVAEEVLITQTEGRAPSRTRPNPSLTVPTQAPRPRPAHKAQVSSRVAPKARLRVEVLSPSNEAWCSRCGSASPIGSRRCGTCNGELYEDRPGLRCPLCGAPLVYATKLSPDRRVCGVCFSDLRLVAE